MSATATLEPPTAAPEIDPAKAEAFAGRMLSLANDAMLSLLVSIGARSGLYDQLAGTPPATSAEIALKTGLNERYVREWLGAMTAGRIIEYDASAKTYWLPAEHALCTTSAAGPDNLAFFTQYVSLFASVEDAVLDCFRQGGGVPYSAFGKFQALQAKESGPIYDLTLVDRTLPAIPGIVARLQAGIDVADVGCGSGHALNVMARAFPRSRFTGLDISSEGLAAGRSEAEAWRLGKVTFSEADVAKLTATAAYDFITAFDSIHDQVAPRAVLAGIRKALRPDGTFLMVDIAASSNLEENLEHPMAAALYSVSTLHCMTVSLAHGGEGLGTMWGEQKAREYLAAAGFGSVETARVEGDMFNTYYVARA